MPIIPHTHPALTGGQFALISGAGPKYRPEIDGGHKGLEQHLAERGFKYEQTYGQHEPSFIVHNIPRDQAMELGRKAGQEHIIHSNLGQHEFVYVNGPQAGKYHPGSGFEHFHRAPTDSGPRLLIPTAGFVRFGIDKSKLLDVPKKGQDMSMNHEKSEVSVADFKKALSKTLQNQINKYSQSLVELAKTEVANSDEQPAVGELKLIKSDFIIEIPDTVCPTCFQNDVPESCTCLTDTGLTKSAFGLTMAAAMQRVYESYKTNVSGPMFPNDPGKAHALAMQVATDWAQRTKSPDAASRMALGHAPEDYAASAHDTTPFEVKNPDSMSPAPLAPKPPGYALVDQATAQKLGVPFQGGNYTAHDQHGNVTTNPGATLHTPAPAPDASLEPQYEPRPARENWGKSELDKSLKTKIAAVGAAAALAGGAIAGGTASTPSDKEVKAHTSKFTQDKQNQPPANPHEKYRKTEGESAMCKTCKSEMCKCMEKGDVKLKDPQAGRRVLTPENFKNRRAIDDKKDDEKRAEYQSKGYDSTVKNMDWKAELDKSDSWMQKSAPPGFGEETMAKLEAKYGTNLGKSVAWAAYKKKNHGRDLAKAQIAGRRTCPKCKSPEVYIDSADATRSECGDCNHTWDLTYPGSTKPAPKPKLKKGAEEYRDLDLGNSPHYKGFYDLAIQNGYPHHIAHPEALAWMKQMEHQQQGDSFGHRPGMEHAIDRATPRADSAFYSYYPGAKTMAPAPSFRRQANLTVQGTNNALDALDNGGYNKGEMVIDEKNAGARPTSTDQAKTGAPRLKNEGFENDKPAPPSKDVPGKLDEGSGGKVTKGKGLNKFDLAPGAPVAGSMAASEMSEKADAAWKAGRKAHPPSKEHLEREKEQAARPPHTRVDATGADVARVFEKAGPPMAKPPGGGTGLTPKMPGQSKPGSAKPISTTPKLPKPPKMGAPPKMAGALGKALPPMGAKPTGLASIAAAGKQPIQSMTAPTPKTGPGGMAYGVDKAPMPGPGRTPGANFTPAKLMGKSEEQFQDLKKSLGSCLNCGKTEHPGVCNAT